MLGGGCGMFGFGLGMLELVTALINAMRPGFINYHVTNLTHQIVADPTSPHCVYLMWIVNLL